MIDKIYCIEKEEKSKTKILSKLSFMGDKFYSYECTNNNELSAYINEGTMETNIKINIKNNGTLDWPQNKTKLIFENNSDIRGNEIKLKGQKCGEEYKYEVKFKNLQNLKEGEYISYIRFEINGETIGEKLALKNIIIKIDNIDYIDKIIEFRENFALDENVYSNEKLLEVLKNNDFNEELAFGELFS